MAIRKKKVVQAAGTTKRLQRKQGAKKGRPAKRQVPKQQHTTQRITRSMLIGDAVAQYPSIIQPLMEAGIHCVGCGAAYSETLGEGLASHGKTKQEIEELITALNKSVPDEIRLGKLAITEPAAKKLAHFLALNTKGKHGLRITVVPGGCAGHTYAFDLEDKKRAGDAVFTTHGATIYVDKKSMQLLDGAKIDYVETFQGGGFRIVNPNAKKTCGCGSSYG